jgi:type I restriction enzyme S subunit
MEVIPGYKQTEFGLIPEEWEVAPIKRLVFLVIDNRGKTPPLASHGHPLIEVNAIYGASRTPDFTQVTKFVDQKTYESWFRRGHPKLDDILIATVGTAGASAIVGDELGCVAQNIVGLRIAKNYNAGFVFQFTRTERFLAQVRAVLMGAVQPSLKVPHLLSFSVPLPATETEQRTIAEALSDVDGLLGGLDRLIAKKRDLKQAAMQQLLTGQTRLPGFSGEWEVKRLGDLGSTYGGLTGKTKADFGNGDARYITFMNVIQNVVIDSDSFDHVDVSHHEIQNLARKGDLFFNGSSETPEEVALCAVLLDEVQDVYLNSFCFGFRFREDMAANGIFFAYYLRGSVGRELIKSLAQGSTRYNLSKVALLNSSLLLPSYLEQTAIAEVLTGMDTELVALEQRRNKTAALKQGMMQELLTGRTRLV